MSTRSGRHIQGEHTPGGHMKYRQVGGHTQGRHMEDWTISRSPGSGDYCWVHFKAFPCCQQEKVTIGDRIRCWLSGPSVRKLLVSFLAHGGHSGAIAGVVLGCGGEGAFKIWSGGLVGQNPCDRLPCLNRYRDLWSSLTRTCFWPGPLPSICRL